LASLTLAVSRLGTHSLFWARPPLAAALRAAGLRGFDCFAAGRRLGVTPGGSHAPGLLALLPLLALTAVKLSGAAAQS
jgi:hypothetical protein